MKQGSLFAELSDLRAAWRETIENDGGHCPVCDRWGKRYARPINETMARSLIWLYWATGQFNTDSRWVDVPQHGPRWLVRSNQLPTLRWWGLVERNDNETPENLKHSGLWAVTPLGAAFVRRESSVPDRVFTYNGEVEGVSNKMITIEQCFGTYFDYEETMQAPTVARDAARITEAFDD